MTIVIRKHQPTHLSQYCKNISFSSENGKQSFVETINFHFDKLQNDEIKNYLIIGKVQSGKTRFFLGLIARLFDSRINIIIVFTGITKSLHNQTIDRLFLSFEDQSIHIIDSKKIKQLDVNKKYIICCLKNSKNIIKLIDKLADTETKQVYLIDDESDQASLNNYNYHNIFKDDAKISATNEAIHKLNKKYKIKYIQITATPAAHILSDVLDDFSPNAIATLTPHENYRGNKDFIRSSEKINICDNSVDTYIKFLVTYGVNAFDLNNNQQGLKNISGLVLSEYIINKNEDISYSITTLLNKIVSEGISTLRSNYTYGLSDFSDEQINKCKSILKLTRVQKVFDDHDHNIKWNEFYDQNKYFILIGGNKIQRGFTCEGLITTILTRTAKGKSNADTVQQRARFFGNKGDIFQYCSVFMLETIYQQFLEYYQNEENLFSSIGDYILKDNLHFNYEEYFSHPTRKNVISNFSSLIKSDQYYPIYSKYNTDEEVYINLIGNSVHVKNQDGQDIYKISSEYFKVVLEKYFNYNKRQSIINKQVLNTICSDYVNFVDLKQLNGDTRTRNHKFSASSNRYVPNPIHQGYNRQYIGDFNILISDSNINIHLSYNYLYQIDEYCTTLLFRFL